MTRYIVVLATLLIAQPALAQTLDVTGDAAIMVMPDRVRLFLGVESRNQNLVAAKAANDASVRQVIDAARAMSIAPADIQTDYMQVSLRYDNNAETVVNHYIVTKDVQILLRSVDQFEELLSRVLLAGANHIYDIDFSTSELRKHRDAARALAMKAAQEKAADLAAAAGLKLVGTPTSVSSYSYGGGASYGRGRSSGYGQMSQNVVQNIGSGSSGISADGTIALGKISVTATVSVSYRMQPQ
jgi:uncharacterized protein YggE